jgi:hypothetical protein
MSANRDKDQKVTFLFPHLHQNQAESQVKNSIQAEPPKSNKIPSYSKVIKAGDLKNSHFGTIRVNPYTPSEVVGKRVQTPQYLQPSNGAAIKSLQDNLKSLTDLQARLRFMLKELEGLIDEEQD